MNGLKNSRGVSIIMNNEGERKYVLKIEEWFWIMASVICGFICHGTTFYNTLIFHDDAALRFHMSDHYLLANGRWTFEIITMILNTFGGTEGLPVVFGIMSLLCLAFSWLIIVRLFDFKEFYSKVLLLIFINVLPFVTANFGYLSSSIYNFLGFLITTFGTSLVCEGSKIERWRWAIGIIVISIGIGEYQCMICLSATIMLLYYLKEIYDGGLSGNKDIFLRGCKYLFSLVMSLVAYLIVLHVMLKLMQMELSSYAGIDTYGIVSILAYIDRFILSYQIFFMTGKPRQWSVFPFKSDIWHMILLVLLATLIAIYLYKLFKTKKTAQAGWSVAIFLLLPLVINSMVVLYDYSRLHSLHTYSYIGLFLWIIYLLEKNEIKKSYWKNLAVGYLGFMAWLYFRYGNLCYFQMEIMQARSVAYFTELKTRIQSTEGYNDSTQILFLNDRKKIIPEMTSTVSSSDEIITNPFTGYDIPNGYAWRNFMSAWIGWRPSEVQEVAPKWKDDVDAMECYPYSDSIRMMKDDNVIIVKF